jgi:hypothetical protein
MGFFYNMGSNNPHFFHLKKQWKFFTLEMHVFFNQEYYFCNTLDYQHYCNLECDKLINNLFNIFVRIGALIMESDFFK